MRMDHDRKAARQSNQRSLHLALWIAQWVLAAGFSLIGFLKLGVPGGDTAPPHVMGAVEVAVALAAILSATTRLLPLVSALAPAALGVIAMVGLAMPSSSAGAGPAWANVVLAALGAFVAWGRLMMVPLAPFPADEGDASADRLARAQVAQARARLQERKMAASAEARRGTGPGLNAGSPLGAHP